MGKRLWIGFVLGAGLLAAPAAAPGAGRPPERPDDPYVPGAARGTVAGNVVFGDFVHVQVNVDGDGNNVPDDAANEPSIAVDPLVPNRLAIGWRQFDNIASNFRQAGHNHSTDGGRTWAAKGIIEPGLFRSDPVLLGGPDGTFYYLSLTGNFTSDLFISDDGGATWRDKSFAFGGDKQWLALDTSGGQGDGHLYQAWNIAGNQYFPAQFNRSTDGGQTWEFPVQYDPAEKAFPVFGLVTVGPDGAVYVAGQQNSTATDLFWVVRSTDAQNPALTPSFDVITELDLGGQAAFGGGPNPEGLLGQINIDVDGSEGPPGTVYVLGSIDPPGPDPMDIHLIRSDDGGQTFGSPVRVNDDAAGPNNWQWFGQMSIAPNGRIDVIFNDTRNSGQENLSALFYSFSTDGGQTWSPNQQVSPQFDSFVGWPDQNKLGDYYDIVSDDVGAHVAWAATFNGEQDVYYLRLGDYDCNVNGIGDATDIANMTSSDVNANGIPDECEDLGCPWDCADGDGVVGILDFLALLAQWNQVGTPCDFDGDGVDILDFLALLANWGRCP